MLVLEGLQSRPCICANSLGIRDQLGLFQFFQDRHGCGTGYRVAGKGTEIAVPFAELGHDVRFGHHCANGVPIGHRFAEGQNVRHDPHLLVGPKMGAGAPETRLHLVADQDAARLAHQFGGGVQPAVGIVGKSFVQKIRADDQGGKTNPVMFNLLDLVRHGGCKTRSVGIGVTIAVWRFDKSQILIEPEADGRRVGSAQLAHQRRVAVIRGVGRNDPALSGHGLGHAQSDVIGFGPGASQNGGIERRRHGPCEPFDIVEDSVVQVPGMRVQRAGLTTDRLNDTRVTMPDMRHIVVAVEVFSPVGIPKPNALTFHEMDRIIVEGRYIRPQESCAIVDQFIWCACQF